MTAPSRRENIAAGLFALVSAAAGTAAGLVTSSRVLRSFDSVEPAAMPALFQTQTSETQERTQNMGLPAKRTMHFSIFLYTADAQQVDVVVSTQLNNMIEAIETALAPCPLTGKLTLNNLCDHAWIEGTIEYYEGVTQDGKSIAIIPIAVLIP